MKTFKLKPRLSFVKLLVLMVMAAAFLPAMTQVASAIARGYATDDTELKPGMVAALSEGSTADVPKARRATQNDGDKIIGVTTTPDDELITITSGEQEVYIQVSGEVDAFVSDINGQIENGDLLTISPIMGVLMKADDNSTTIIGIALEDLDESSAQTKTIASNGETREVKVVKTRLNLDRKAASNQRGDPAATALQRLGQSISGRHDVSEVQVLAALVIFLLVLVAEGAIMYGAVTSSITALGRNPMARNIILREMSRVIVITFGVLVVGLAAIYGILRI